MKVKKGKILGTDKRTRKMKWRLKNDILANTMGNII